MNKLKMCSVKSCPQCRDKPEQNGSNVPFCSGFFVNRYCVDMCNEKKRMRMRSVHKNKWKLEMMIDKIRNGGIRMYTLIIIAYATLSIIWRKDNSSKKEKLMEVFKLLIVTIGIDYIEKGVLFTDKLVWKMVKKFLELFPKLKEMFKMNSSHDIFKDMANFFFKFTDLINPNIEKYMIVIADNLYVKHLFATCVIIMICLEVLLMNCLWVDWRRMLTEKKSLVTFILLNVHVISTISYEIEVGYDTLRKSVNGVFSLCAVCIWMFWGWKRGYLFKKEQNSIAMQKTSQILEDILLIFAILAFPLMR